MFYILNFIQIIVFFLSRNKINYWKHINKSVDTFLKCLIFKFIILDCCSSSGFKKRVSRSSRIKRMVLDKIRNNN